jgi:F0F1-type ATP synthase assembly protein I
MKKDSFSALGLAWNLGYTIAVPLVVLALGGRFLDRKLGTSPWILLAGILFSIALSSWLVYKKTLDIIGK